MAERIAWLLLGAVHLLPAVALFRPALITRLYGVAPDSPIFLLLHHRAALFAVVLLMCLWAANDATVRPLATVAVAVSMVSFLLLYARAGSPRPLRTIAVADLVGLPILLFAGLKAFGIV